jgi:hypothetical protein
MNRLLLAFALLVPGGALAQELSPSLTAPAVASQYCTLLATGTSYSGIQLELDLGRMARKYLGEVELAEAKADQVAVHDMFTVADALNYLASRGWECIGVSTLSRGLTAPQNTSTARAGSTLAVGYSEVQYLMHRRGR